MSIIYFDCEFTDLIGIESDIKLISAGFVAPDGGEFYFELTDNWKPEDCNAFVHEAVLPHLNTAKHGMTLNQAARRLKEWLEGFTGPVQLATDAPAWDWPLIAELLDDHKCRPDNLMAKPLNVNVSNVQQEIESFFECQPMAIRHHALWDARALAYAAEVQSK